MSHRSLFFALSALSAVAVVSPVWADTVTEKPRLAIALAGANDFAKALKTQLEATHRFVIVDKPSLKAQLAKAKIVLDGELSVRDSLRARALTGADIVVDGALKRTNGEMQITTRLYDFRTGEFSRDLSLIGATGDTATLAGQLAGFVRHSAPIRCRIKDVNDDQIELDLGEMDGVKVNTVYRVYRHPLNVKPLEIGLVRVKSVQPFAALAEVEEVPKGITLQRGDALEEQTADLLLAKP